MGGIRRLWVLGLLGFLLSCAGIQDWDRYAEYQESRDFSRERYEAKLLESKKREVKERAKEESLYEKEVKDAVVKLLRTPPAPVKTPDKVLRVLILPWVDENGNLNTQKYIFVKVEEGKWILGDYLGKEGEGVKTVTPLKEVTE